MFYSFLAFIYASDKSCSSFTVSGIGHVLNRLYSDHGVRSVLLTVTFSRVELKL